MNCRLSEIPITDIKIHTLLFCFPALNVDPGTGPFHGHWRLTFNSTSLPPDTELATYSTLAVYSRHCQPNWRQTEAGRMMKAAGVHKTNISVYATDHRHYADIRPFNVAWDRVKMKGKCWRTFDVTAAVRLWQQRRTRGMRHLILQQKGYDSLNVDAFLRLHSEDSPGNRPVLIVYSGKAIQLPSGSGRHRRDTQDAGDTSSGYNKSDPIKDNKHLDCARREFEIDFKKSGWDKWIISPLRYKAYRCAGACHFPIHPSIRSTLHARLEASVTHRNQQTGIVDHLEGSGPCCVPTLHSSITLLVHTSSGGSLRHIAQKMVAERCGCR